MSLVLDLPSRLEERIEAEARKVGLSSAAYVLQLIETAVPLSTTETARALFAQWAEEDAALTPEEREDNARIYAEIEKNGIPRVRL